MHISRRPSRALESRRCRGEDCGEPRATQDSGEGVGRLVREGVRVDLIGEFGGFLVSCGEGLLHRLNGHAGRVTLASQHADKPAEHLIGSAARRAELPVDQRPGRGRLGFVVQGLEGFRGHLGIHAMLAQLVGEDAPGQASTLMTGRHPHPRECGVIDDPDFVVAVEDLGNHLFGDLLTGQRLRKLGTRARPHGELPQADVARHLGLTAWRLGGTLGAALPRTTVAAGRTTIAPELPTVTALELPTVTAPERPIVTPPGVAESSATAARPGATAAAS